MKAADDKELARLGSNEFVVIYARYSSHGQTEQSIEGQLRDCYAYAERMGYKVVREYIDRALTARSDDRPAFQQMVTDAKKKQFRYILVWKLDRFARNRYDSAHYKNQLKKQGVRVVSITENITDSPEGIMMEGMLESLAEYYSANLSKHVRRGQRESVLKGTYTGGMPPFGFKVENKRLVADPDKAPIIRYAFQQYADGIPKKQIVAELNEKGVRNSAGNPLTVTSFQHALHNEKYIGVYRFNGEEVVGGCEAIVDEVTFRRVQKRLEKVRHAPAASKARQSYLLQGKAFCGLCGATLVGHSGTSKQGISHYYYACAVQKKHHTCKKKTERKIPLERQIVELTLRHVLAPREMLAIATRLEAEFEKEFGDSSMADCQRRIDKLEKEINRALDASLEVDSKAARERYIKKIDLMEAQKADLELDLARLQITSQMRYSKEQIMAWMKTFCDGDISDEAYQKRIIDFFVRAVFVFDDRIAIYYNIRDGEQTPCDDILEGAREVAAGTASLEGAGVRISNGTPRQGSNPCLSRRWGFLF